MIQLTVHKITSKIWMKVKTKNKKLMNIYVKISTIITIMIKKGLLHNLYRDAGPKSSLKKG